MIITMIIFTNEFIVAISIILMSLAFAIYIILYKIKQGIKKTLKADNHLTKQISIAFYLGTSNIIVLIFALLNNYYC